MTDQTTVTSDSKRTLQQDVKDAVPDFTAMLERFKLPGFDLDGFLQSRKLDIEAVTRGTSAAFAGAQTIVEKQAELLKTVLTEVSDALSTFQEEATRPAELIRKQQELANEALSSALASMKEIADAAGKSQAEILEIASDRVRSNVDEIRRLVKRQQPEAK